MLRSKNLKRVLEQALTHDIRMCAVFNEDGVVLAHAATSNPFSSGSDKDSEINRSSLQTPSINKGRQQRPPSSGFIGDDTQQIEGERAPEAQPGIDRDGKHASRADRLQSKIAGTQLTTANMPYEQLHVVQSPSLNRASGSGATRLQEDSQATEGQSFSSSQSDDLADTSPSMSTREKLEDDLAIAANLWQSYESMPNLIERKERDVDEYAGDAASDMHDDDVNSLNMIIIECEHGKAVVARLGVYRLFLLSRPTAPLGLLKVKSDNLRHFLASNLVCHSS